MISKDRNFSSYSYHSIPRFLHGQILFHLDNPDPNPVERKTISNPNPKNQYPAGLDSKFRILYTTARYLKPLLPCVSCSEAVVAWLESRFCDSSQVKKRRDDVMT